MKIIKGIVTHKTEIEVPFYDVDSLNLAWHGHYIKYFEVARCELLSIIKYNYHDMKLSGYIWPIIDLRVKYVKPARFGQKIIVESSIIEYENRLKIQYVIYDKNTSERLTKAYTTQVAICAQTNKMCFVSPNDLTDKLKKYL